MLVGVTEARAKATSIQLTPELINDPEAFAKFQAAQGELTQALKSLLAVTENYPELKSDANFRDLQVAARRHGKPHRRGAQSLHRLRAGVQRDGARVPDQPHREDVRLRREAQLHRGERSRDLHGADGDFDTSTPSQSAAPVEAAPAPATPPPRTDSARESRCWSRSRCCSARAACRAARAQIALPTLEARVTDLTGTLTAAQQSALEEKLAAFEARKGAQIAVLILPTTQPEDIAQFGIRLAEAWKIGRKAHRRRRDPHRRQGRSRAAHRSRSWPRRRAHRRHQQPHHQRHHRAAVQAGRFLRRRECRPRPDDPRDRRRAAAGAGPGLEARSAAAASRGRSCSFGGLVVDARSCDAFIGAASAAPASSALGGGGVVWWHHVASSLFAAGRGSSEFSYSRCCSASAADRFRRRRRPRVSRHRAQAAASAVAGSAAAVAADSVAAGAAASEAAAPPAAGS